MKKFSLLIILSCVLQISEAQIALGYEQLSANVDNWQKIFYTWLSVLSIFE